MQINTTDTATMTLTVKIEEYFMKTQKTRCLLMQLQMSHLLEIKTLGIGHNKWHNMPKA